MWTRVTFGMRDGTSRTIHGFSNEDAQLLRDHYFRARRSYFDHQAFLTELNIASSKLRSAEAAIAAFEDSKTFVTASDRDRFVRQFEGGFWNAEITRGLPTGELGRTYLAIREYLACVDAQRAAINERIIASEQRKHQVLLDSLDRRPLTDEQRRACVIDEDRQRIVAGAGCGKTSVLRAKAAYLIASGKATPEQIVALSYSRKSADELDRRLKAYPLTDAVAVSTVHSLAYSLLGRLRGRKPAASHLVDDVELTQFLQARIRQICGDLKTADDAVAFLAYYLRPYRPTHSFQTPGQYYDYLQNVDLLTLNGERVKSFEEAEIANFLYLNGVRYEYEPAYPTNVATPEFRQYKPDFYLCDNGIYIEHFGIMRDGATAPGIDRETYHKGMAWKRQLHQRYGTKLVETYSFDRAEGRLRERLSERLKSANVVLRPIPTDVILEKLHSSGELSYAAQLFADCLRIYKEIAPDPGLLRERLLREDEERAKMFLSIFHDLHSAYRDELNRSQEIDYADMLRDCTRALQHSDLYGTYKYILIDEFQDMSQSKAAFIEALLKWCPGAKLVAVGDDWQAIYRFNGCDIGLFKDFEQRFGPCSTSILTKTFRFDDRLARVSDRFILENPAQLRKHLCADRDGAEAAIVVLYVGEADNGLTNALQHIYERSAAGEDVLVLARTNDSLAYLEGSGSLRIRSSTAHGAKGCEADYTVILHVNDDNHGFPCLKVTDPLIEALLPTLETFPFAEERRLFYVALTRARKKTYLVVQSQEPSHFAREIAQYGPQLVQVLHSDSVERQDAAVMCRACQSGVYVRRTGRNGPFWGCSKFPYCEETMRGCPSCGECVTATGDFFRCSRQGCSYRELRCPKCARGELKQRQNKATGETFWGCSYWRADALGCDFSTREVQAV